MNTSPYLNLRHAIRVNLAMQHNAVPVMQELVVRNPTDEDWRNVRLSLTADPAFVHSREWCIDHLPAGGELPLQDLKLDLDRAFLEQLPEAVRGSLCFRLEDARNALLWEARSELEILARDEWGGIAELPEIIAAFVQPNHPAVEELLRQSARLLRQAGLPDGLEGYQSGRPQRVGELVSALWSAVAAQGLHYAVPPASFETQGQKVRNPGRILKHQLATCLDSSLLFASALEQMGLRPLVILLRGHALIGCWLQEEDLSHALVRDAQALRKRVRLNELLVFETTLVTEMPAVGFARACATGADKLEDDVGFVMAVDIHRARMAGIRPLPHAGMAPEAEAEPESPPAPPPLELPAELLEPDTPDAPAPQEQPPETPDARVERWKRKLLDLSLRNKLLNFRMTRLALRLHCPEPDRLEDRLADGQVFKLLPMPQLEGRAGLRDQQLHEQQSGEDLYDDYARHALDKKELLVWRQAEALESALLDLYRAARAAQEEGGSNLLHLALGFLRWTPKGRDREALAPLILLPVSLHRRSVRSGFRLSLHEDEARFNPTLLELWRQDYGLKMTALEGELPTDEHGLDVKGIWRQVRREIRDIAGWEVVEDVVLSTFSFAKYLMWQDLVAHGDRIKEAPLVRHLVETPRQPYPPRQPFPQAGELDQSWPLADTYCPLLADSSQRVAVRAAAQGNDFVLVGPPGTGKSQTIANLIAQCMAEGKSVLFVSEKTAALDVVFRRLREVGLGDHCLELHSHKARKLDVLKQLERAWNSRASLDQAAWQALADRLEAKRQRLNAYVQHLHQPQTNGLSLYQALGWVVEKQSLPRLPLAWGDPDQHDRAALEDMQSLVQHLARADEQLGGVRDHPLALIGQTRWSPGWQRTLLDQTGEVENLFDRLEHSAQAYLALAGLPDLPPSRENLRRLLTLHDSLLQGRDGNRAFLLGGQRQRWRSELGSLVDTLRKFRQAWQGLSVPYAPLALERDTAALQLQWQQSLSAWWGKRWFMQRSVRKALSALTRKGEAPKDIGADLQRLVQASKYRARLQGHGELTRQLGKDWQEQDTPPEAMQSLLDWSLSLSRQLRQLEVGGGDWRAPVETLLQDAPERLTKGQPLEKAGAALAQAHEAWRASLEQLAQQAGTPLDVLLPPARPEGMARLRSHFAQWRQQAAQLKYWCAWRELRGQAVDAGLQGLVDWLEQQGDAQALPDLFMVNYCRWWLEARSEQDELLRAFVPAEQEYRIQRFQALDDELTGLTARAIRARLCARLPDKESPRRNTAWGVLARELQKKRRHKPLRQLLALLGEELPRLTPCVMMSPLSIAQYLPADGARFDLVVFDEASQIPTWDAIGAIARGKQAVIVGDPKQLPPTSFFQRADNDEFDEELEVDELESILDECLGANVSAIHLDWHYRSRDESLIAFSNQHYYDGRLVTFPGPVAGDSMVRYRHVPEGVYEKGGSRTNPGEARALVAAIVAWLRDPGFRQSIGVVTFNMEQQVLIQDLLEQARREHPEIEPHFAEDALEPVFVKNLESVQGDERDIILFSITYGPDAQGKVSMNFGPLNRAGGQRRLNVAVTRARHALWVYAALQPHQIDLSRSKAQGVQDLKAFLAYAQQGTQALDESSDAVREETTSAFERAVHQALEARGWKLHSRVGVSRFRIDLAVVDPDDAQSYLAAVETDGPNYHQAATARDRDKLRELVLTRLGWRLLRVWAPDWWVDPQGAAERLHQQLREYRDQARKKRQAEGALLELPPPA